MEPVADEPRLRSFVAIALADPARTAVVEYLEHLRATVGGVAWTRPDNLHLTLKFLGDVALSRMPPLTDRLRAAAAAQRPFTVRVTGVGAFPNLARPRALWVGMTSPALGALVHAVETACEAEGFAAERHAFRPHVTLGRVRERGRSATRFGRDRLAGEGRRAQAAPDLAILATDGGRDFGASPVAGVVLFRSELHRDGARYSALATLPLEGE